MKNRALLLPVLILLLVLPAKLTGQNCSITGRNNGILPDGKCSPVTVQWTASYLGVNHNGASVAILFQWDDGTEDLVPATEINAATDEWEAVFIHVYDDLDLRCNYAPVAYLVVDGVTCTSSNQEQSVTVWDVDNLNGGIVEAAPGVFPVCIGSGATMNFSDNTLFNCVPPKENDDPNEDTRWIQWVYGTNIGAGNYMSGDPVTVGGVVRAYPYEGPVIKLDGPIHASSEISLPIVVGSNNALGDEFQVELRYWNQCNPYEPVYNPYVEDRSVIRVVDNPDPTINHQPDLCEFSPAVTLSAATGGGTWSGTGISDASAGTFSPALAGSGSHLITYNVTNGDGCSASDNETIGVMPAPDGSITPVDPLCLDGSAVILEAATSTGTWSGTGITNTSTGIFEPAVAGLGTHRVAFRTATDPSGCYGTDTTDVQVLPPPYAAFVTEDSSWCQAATNSSFGTVVFTGTNGSVMDLVYEMGGRIDTLFNMSPDTFQFLLNNAPGENLYVLHKVTEYHGSNSCETLLDDTLRMMVNPIPDASMVLDYGDLCSPVRVNFSSDEGYRKYTWNFGDGPIETSSHLMTHTFTFDYVGTDMSRDDSTYMTSLKVETFAGCSDSIETALTVYPIPITNFAVHPDILQHPDSVVQLTNMTSPGNWNYLWDYGDGSSDIQKDPGEHTYRASGVFDIELTSYNAFCEDSMVRRVQILPPPPIAAFRPDTLGCPPLRVQFHNSSEHADSYLWDFDDGRYSNEPNPDHVFLQNREYYVKLTAIGLSGTDLDSSLVYVYNKPQIDFQVNPTSSKNLKQLFKFTVESINAETFLWDFGDGTTSADEKPTHIYGDSGTYTIGLTAWSEQGCPDTLVKAAMIHVEAGEGSIKVPTAFIWKGGNDSDGYWEEGVIDNTIFHPAMVNAASLRLLVFNRWGEQIFESNEVYRGWNGYLKNGELAAEGVYFWKAWIKYVDGFEEIKVGDITFFHDEE